MCEKEAQNFTSEIHLGSFVEKNVKNELDCGACKSINSKCDKINELSSEKVCLHKDSDELDQNKSNDLTSKKKESSELTFKYRNSSLRKRFRNSSTLTISHNHESFSPERKKSLQMIETDPVVLARRQKQIDYGKNTVGYDVYIQAIPKKDRKSYHPKTPPKHFKYSRRAWDGLVKVWRQQLHYWDKTE